MIRHPALVSGLPNRDCSQIRSSVIAPLELTAGGTNMALRQQLADRKVVCHL